MIESNIKEIKIFIEENEIENIAFCYLEKSNEKSIKTLNCPKNGALKEGFIIVPAACLQNVLVKENAFKIGQGLNFKSCENNIACSIESSGLVLNDICLTRAFVNPFFVRKTLVFFTNNAAILEENNSFRQIKLKAAIHKGACNSFHDYINELVSVACQVGLTIDFVKLENNKEESQAIFNMGNSKKLKGYDNLRLFIYLANTIAEIFNIELADLSY